MRNRSSTWHPTLHTSRWRDDAFAGAGQASSAATPLSSRGTGVAVTLPRPDDGSLGGPRVVDLDAVTVDVQLAEAGLAYARWVKPVVDRVLAALLLLVLLVPILVVALVVRLELGSPVFFVQPRVGRGGQLFRMVKFRTMRPDRRQGQGDFEGPDRRRTHKHPNDPRLTPVGRFLRTWSLDELPQLVNVLLGHMSLVGPRPELVAIVERYEPWQHLRHVVKPGVTGLWQVSSRGDEPMHERTDVDIDYLRHLGPWTDLKILALTLPAALGYRRGF